MITLSKIQAFIDAAVSIRNDMDDNMASNYIDLYSTWISGKSYRINERVNYNGILYKVLQDHVSQNDWTPDVAVSLFAKVLTSIDSNEILPWTQPDSTNPYMVGDKVLHNNKTWICIIDNNVWEPGIYGWEEI